jgi:hypothetical protein
MSVLVVVLVQGPLVPEEFIQRQDMKFDYLDEAYDYYCDYAKMAGFDVPKGRKSPQLLMRTSILHLQLFLPLRYLTLLHDHEHNN